MATIKQKKAIRKLVENGGNASKAMRDAGYSKKTAINPSKLTESKGYLEILDQYGLTDELIISSLSSDIREKPKNRKPELELAAKMRGMIIDHRDITTGGDKLNGVLILPSKDATNSVATST